MIRFTMFRGDSFSFTITALDDAGPINLTGKSLIATFKNAISDVDGSAVAQKRIGTGITVISAPAGTASIKLSPADTRSLPDTTTSLEFDVQLVDGSDLYTIARGQLSVEPDVTIAAS